MSLPLRNRAVRAHSGPRSIRCQHDGMEPGISAGQPRQVRAGTLLVGLLVFVVAGCSSPAAPTDLAEAVDTGNGDAVRQLLAEGQDPDLPLTLGLTPLMRAANRGHAEIARILIDASANIDADSNGLTAVHLAAGADAVETLTILLDAGADPRVRSASGMNALDYAADAGATETPGILMEAAGMDADQPSEVVTQGHGYPRDRGPTPLGLAVIADRVDSTRALLELGADVDALSSSGHTPLLLAVFLDASPDIVEMLLNAGASADAAAACDTGCSTGEGRPLTVGEWAEELNRTDLLTLLESR